MEKDLKTLMDEMQEKKKVGINLPIAFVIMLEFNWPAAQADGEYLEKMKEESKGLPRLRLDMLRQLKSALAEGFSKNDKTGNRYEP